jgi:hypothetical protein
MAHNSALASLSEIHLFMFVTEGHLGGCLWERFSQSVSPPCGLSSCRTDVRPSPAAAAWHEGCVAGEVIGTRLRAIAFELQPYDL